MSVSGIVAYHYVKKAQIVRVYALYNWPMDFRISACKCIALADPKISHTTIRKVFLNLEVNCRPNYELNLNLNSVALVRERTIPTERPPPVGEVSANFLRIEGITWSAQRFPTAVLISVF